MKHELAIKRTADCTDDKWQITCSCSWIGYSANYHHAFAYGQAHIAQCTDFRVYLANGTPFYANDADIERYARHLIPQPSCVAEHIHQLDTYRYACSVCGAELP